MAHTGIDEDHIVLLQQPGLSVPAVFRPSMEQDIQFIFRFMPVVAEVHHLMDISGAEQVFPGATAWRNMLPFSCLLWGLSGNFPAEAIIAQSKHSPQEFCFIPEFSAPALSARERPGKSPLDDLFPGGFSSMCKNKPFEFSQSDRENVRITGFPPTRRFSPCFPESGTPPRCRTKYLQRQHPSPSAMLMLQEGSAVSPGITALPQF